MSFGPAETDGPWITAALICEKALQEPDGVISAIRVIDRIAFVLDEHNHPRFPQQPVVFYIALKPGPARGRYVISVEREAPSTQTNQIFSVPVFFEAEDRGVNVVVNAMFEPEGEGLHWFNIYLADPPEVEDGRRVLLTRIQLRATYLPMPTVGPQ